MLAVAGIDSVVCIYLGYRLAFDTITDITAHASSLLGHDG